MRSALSIGPLVSDDTTFSTPGTAAEVNNMRRWRGQWQTIGGWNSAFSTALTGVCRNVLSWTGNDGTSYIAFGTHSKLMVYVGGELHDITPAGLAEGPIDGAPGAGYGAGPYSEGDYGEPATNFEARTWSLDTYGQSLIASPRGGTIYQWDNDTATPAAAVTNAPAKCNAVMVTPERQILALGCNEEVSGDYNPLCIRGSDIEDPTEWTTSAANNAFEHILEGGGTIMTGRKIGAFVAIWTNGGVHLGQFVGSLGQAYRFDRVDDNCGLIGPNAVAVMGQVAFWCGPDFQFRQWSLGASPQLLPCPVRNDFKDHIETTQVAKITASTVSQFGEVWWFYPDTREGNENSRYIALGTQEGGGWFQGQMARSAACDAGVAAYPMAVTPDGAVYYHENGNTANGGALAWSIRSGDQYLNSAQQALAVRCAYPDFEDQHGSIAMTLYMRAYPQSDPVTHGPYTLEQGQSKKDFRASGRVISIEFAGLSSPAYARLGKPQFDTVPVGNR